MTPAEQALTEPVMAVFIILLAGLALWYLRDRVERKEYISPYERSRRALEYAQMGAPQPPPVQTPACPACGEPMGEDMVCRNPNCQEG